MCSPIWPLTARVRRNENRKEKEKDIVLTRKGRKELRLIGDALNVGPEDQSLWYYHQFLMLNLAHADGKESFTPGLAQEERIAYVKDEIVNIKDLLEDYADVKWIHEVLVEYTVALARLQGRRPDGQETEDLRAWLGKLRTLDPMRNGRWDELEKQLGLEEKA